MRVIVLGWVTMMGLGRELVKMMELGMVLVVEMVEGAALGWEKELAWGCWLRNTL